MQDFPFVGFLPSVPILFPPLLATSLNTLNAGGHGERYKDPERVQSRVPAGNTFWVGAPDPNLSRLQGLRIP